MPLPTNVFYRRKKGLSIAIPHPDNILGCLEKNVVFGRRSLKIQKHLCNKYIFNQSKLHKIEYICANVGQCHRCLFYKSRQILSQERSGKLFLHLSEFQIACPLRRCPSV